MDKTASLIINNSHMPSNNNYNKKHITMSKPENITQEAWDSMSAEQKAALTPSLPAPVDPGKEARDKANKLIESLSAPLLLALQGETKGEAKWETMNEALQDKAKAPEILNIAVVQCLGGPFGMKKGRNVKGKEGASLRSLLGNQVTRTTWNEFLILVAQKIQAIPKWEVYRFGQVLNQDKKSPYPLCGELTRKTELEKK